MAEKSLEFEPGHDPSASETEGDAINGDIHASLTTSHAAASVCTLIVAGLRDVGPLGKEAVISESSDSCQSASGSI
jgi:hypothetical protein